MDKIKVGDKEPKEVTPENHELYEKAYKIMDDVERGYFMGKCGISKLVDYIEETYGLEKKEK